MPFCPNCKTEYREGFTTCSDCGTPLVFFLPNENQAEQSHSYSYSPFTVLTKTNTSFEASSLIAFLQDNKIPCFTQSCDNLSELSKIYTGASLHGENVLVRECDLAYAQELLSAYFSNRTPVNTEDLETQAMAFDELIDNDATKVNEAPRFHLPRPDKNWLRVLILIFLALDFIFLLFLKLPL